MDIVIIHLNLIQGIITNVKLHKIYSTGKHFQFILIRNCTKIPILQTLCITGKPRIDTNIVKDVMRTRTQGQRDILDQSLLNWP